MKEMAAKYGYDISGPATNAQEAIQWTYFGYLAAVKSQNGAAMSFGRTSTFLDVYIERDLKAGKITEQEAQEMVDHLVMKLRMVRFLRTPEYDELFSGDPIWATESIGGYGPRRSYPGYQKQLPFPEHPVHHGSRLRNRT
ncbi:formate acetyltransferase 1 [Escherichia coli]|nr:formate acetyltransferase 1 [Escherichia coli]